MQDKGYLRQISAVQYMVDKGFVPNMNVPGTFYVNDRLKDLIFEELENSYGRGGVGGFLPAVKQLANVAALPGIVGVSLSCIPHCSSRPELKIPKCTLFITAALKIIELVGALPVSALLCTLAKCQSQCSISPHLHPTQP